MPPSSPSRRQSPTVRGEHARAHVTTLAPRAPRGRRLQQGVRTRARSCSSSIACARRSSETTRAPCRRRCAADGTRRPRPKPSTTSRASRSTNRPLDVRRHFFSYYKLTVSVTYTYVSYNSYLRFSTDHIRFLDIQEHTCKLVCHTRVLVTHGDISTTTIINKMNIEKNPKLSSRPQSRPPRRGCHPPSPTLRSQVGSPPKAPTTRWR